MRSRSGKLSRTRCRYPQILTDFHAKAEVLQFRMTKQKICAERTGIRTNMYLVVLTRRRCKLTRLIKFIIVWQMRLGYHAEYPAVTQNRRAVV